MRALVTGGTGHLGSRIAHALAAQGADVRLTYLPGDNLAAVADLDAEHRPADLLDETALARAFEGVEVAFHTAAMVAFDARVYDRQMHVNIEGTRAVLTAARRAGVRRLVHTSTVNTLGVPPRGTVGNEHTPDNWAPYHLGYMDSKRLSEQLVRDAARSGEVDAVCVLPGTMWGPGDVNWNAGSYVRLIARVPLLVAIPGGTIVAHVDDVAQGHLLALERGRTGRRYILGGEAVRYLQIFRWIAAELDRPAPRVALPSPPLIAAGRALSWLSKRTGIPTPVTEGLMRAACSELYYSSARAVRELGWSFRSARQTLRDAVPWYRDYGSF